MAGVGQGPGGLDRGEGVGEAEEDAGGHARRLAFAVVARRLSLVVVVAMAVVATSGGLVVATAWLRWLRSAAGKA